MGGAFSIDGWEEVGKEEEQYVRAKAEDNILQRL